jgi:hypothetical protein
MEKEFLNSKYYLLPLSRLFFKQPSSFAPEGLKNPDENRPWASAIRLSLQRN